MFTEIIKEVRCGAVFPTDFDPVMHVKETGLRHYRLHFCDPEVRCIFYIQCIVETASSEGDQLHLSYWLQAKNYIYILKLLL